jgi:hypothetical protein
MGQMLDCRAQLMACSIVVVMTFSSKRPSIQGWVICILSLAPVGLVHSTAGQRPAADMIAHCQLV